MQATKRKARPEAVKISIIAAVGIAVCVYLMCCRYIEYKRPINSDYDGKLLAHYIDVGEGDSEFVELPDGRCMLIDSGEAKYAKTVEKYITSLGYDKIDILIATHFHTDHMGAMAHIVERFDIGCFYTTPITGDGEAYRELMSALGKKDIVPNYVKRGVTVDKGEDYIIRAIAPCSTNYEDENDNSVVIMLEYKDTRFLYMADATENSEGEIGENVKADVMKIGHHGSSTSSAEFFLKRAAPTYAVISCGEGNGNGHPSMQVTERLRALGAKIYRTDRCGSITVVSDGYKIETVITEK